SSHGHGTSRSEHFRDAVLRCAVPARAVLSWRWRAHRLSLRSRGAGVIIVLLAVTLYAAAGIGVAAAFLGVGGPRRVPEPAPGPLGGGIMLFPGTAALWPYVLIRWLRSYR